MAGGMKPRWTLARAARPPARGTVRSPSSAASARAPSRQSSPPPPDRPGDPGPGPTRPTARRIVG